MTDKDHLEGPIYAGRVVGEMVNPLEAANNIAYLMSVSANDAKAIDRYIEMLQGQLAVLNKLVLRTLAEARQEQLQANGRNS